ncbi:MAG: aminoacyl-tRNA hydrolase [Cyanobacteria bacterium REEB65]|nr:aminoacyl-tRNA hydrolase [Cyanobacteria bacterium REEB65]
MKLVVGLGNPGPKYSDTRHNAGFAVIYELARRWTASGRQDSRFNAMVAEARVGPEKVLLVQPLTFMNLSGQSVQSMVNFYKIDPSDLAIVSDDADLPIGAIRLRKKGSSGGQKGLQSIIDTLGTAEFPRVRVGVGSKPPAWDMADWVLSRVSPEERPDYDQSIRQAAEAIELWIRRNDFDLAMSRYNTPRSPRTEQIPSPE